VLKSYYGVFNSKHVKRGVITVMI